MSAPRWTPRDPCETANSQLGSLSPCLLTTEHIFTSSIAAGRSQSTRKAHQARTPIDKPLPLTAASGRICDSGATPGRVCQTQAQVGGAAEARGHPSAAELRTGEQTQGRTSAQAVAPRQTCQGQDSGIRSAGWEASARCSDSYQGVHERTACPFSRRGPAEGCCAAWGGSTRAGRLGA